MARPSSTGDNDTDTRSDGEPGATSDTPANAPKQPAVGFGCDDIDADLAAVEADLAKRGDGKPAASGPGTKTRRVRFDAATDDRSPDERFRIHRRTERGFAGVDDTVYKPGPTGADAAQPAGPTADEVQEPTASDRTTVYRVPSRPDAGGDPSASTAGTDGGPTNWCGVVRRELVGRSGPDPCDFHLRHFEVDPGGYSSFEKHRHIHAVIAESGRGEVRIDNEWHPVTPGDVVYVGPMTPHQLRCPDDSDRPFGFFCIVDAVRDRPIPVEDTPQA